MTIFPHIARGLLAISTLALAIAPLQMYAGAIPLQTYYFTGDCSDCTGTGLGTLTLQNYTPGATITTDTNNFVSFSYTSNLTSFSISANQLVFIFGAIPTAPSELPGPAELFLQDNNSPADVFNSTTGGGWCAGAGTACGNDQGTTSSWATATPEPATVIPVVVAVFGFGIVRRRRGQRATAN
jgi:hypothetical protein